MANTIKPLGGFPFQQINEEVLGDLGRQGDFDPFASKEKVTVCYFDIVLGSITQTYKGDEEVTEEDYQSVAQWNRFFTGREVIIARWKEENIFSATLNDVQEEQLVVQDDQIVFSTAEKTLFIYIDKPNYDKTKGLLFKLFMIPKVTGKVLYYPEAIFWKRDEKNNIRYIQIKLREVNDVFNVLKDTRRKHYIHFNAPNENYILPKWNKTTKQVETENITTPKAKYVQLDFFGAFALSGFCFFDNTNDDYMIVAKEPFEPIVSDLYRTQVLNKALCYVTKSNLEYQGQWGSWQERVKNLYDLAVRPKYEGILNIKDMDNIKKPQATQKNTDVGEQKYHITFEEGTNRGSLKREINFTTTSTGSYPYINITYHMNLGVVKGQTGAAEFTNAEVDIILKAFSYFNKGNLTFDYSTATVVPVISNDISPLNKEVNYNFFYTFKTPNLDKTIVDIDFVTFLGYNSIANLDTIRMPLEITEYVSVNASTFPIIGAFLFGIPLGFRDKVARTSTGEYNRTFNFIMPNELRLMLQEGVFGENDPRLSLEVFKENYDNSLISVSGLSYGIRTTLKYIKKGTGETLTTEPESPLHYFILQGLGMADVRLRFFDENERQIWSAYIRTQAQHTDSILDWQTIIKFI